MELYNNLTWREEKYFQKLLSKLKNTSWIQPLLNKIQKEGISAETKSLLFELRFAGELDFLDIEAEYEYKTGVNDSSIDFKITKDNFNWLFELVSIKVSNAVKNATTIKTPYFNGSGVTFRMSDQEATKANTSSIFEMGLSSKANDIRQSEAGEIIIVQQKIGEKVFHKGKPTKFPDICDNTFHIIIVDMRGFLGEGGGGDKYDYKIITHGCRGMNHIYFRFWEGEPIKGIFEKDCPLRSAKTIQERIHFIGFVNETEFGPGEMLKQTIYFPNPNLFDNDSAKLAIEKIPFRTRNSKQMT